jgi:hypothetical protein
MQSFLPEIVDPTRPDGYWAEAFPFEDGDILNPDVVGYGLGTSNARSKIELYLNPYRESSRLVVHLLFDASCSKTSMSLSLRPVITTSGWSKIEIAALEFPVAFS